MIRSEKLNSLNEDEIELLGYILNYWPTERQNKLEVNCFKSVRLNVLGERLSEVQNKLNEEGRKVLNNIIEKLGDSNKS